MKLTYLNIIHKDIYKFSNRLICKIKKYIIIR